MSIKDFFDSLGLNGTWWQWRIVRLEERFKGWFVIADDKHKHVTYEHKMCSHCGSLVDRKDSVCPRCGRSVASWYAHLLKRILGLVLPRWCPVSSLLILVNILLMGVMVALYGSRQLLLPSSEALLGMGALNPWYFLEAHEYWRLVTYGYLHIGILHIFFNLTALSQVGSVLEREIGKSRFFSLYTLSLIGGGVADLIVRGPVSVSIAGASGALFGLIGFGITYYHFYGGGLGAQIRNFFLRWAGYGFLFGYFVHADNICHFGGLVVGAILGFVIERERLWRDRLNPLWTGLAVFCFLITLVAGAACWFVAKNS